jgi:hypothetical protein
MLGENINNIDKISETLLQITKKVDVEKTQRTRHIVMSRHQNVGQNHNLLVANKSFENVASFKSLWTAVRNQNIIQEVIKSRLNSGNIF